MKCQNCGEEIVIVRGKWYHGKANAHGGTKPKGRPQTIGCGKNACGK